MDTLQHIKNIQVYGYTLIPDGLKNHQEILELIKNIQKNASKDNKSLHAERSDDSLIYNLQNKDFRFIKLLSEPYLVNIFKFFLNDEYYQVQDPHLPNYILNYYNARSSGKFLDLHIDSHVPSSSDYTWAMQAAFVLEDMNERNGCTVLVPGSHKSGKYTDRTLSNRIPLIAKAGDIAIWDSRVWHGTLDNISGKSRWVLIATLTRWWLKQTMDMTRSLPQEIYEVLTDAEKLLIGFCSLPPKDEFGSIHTKKDYSSLRKVAKDNLI